ncbi:hypothetical protein [Neptunomonas phycophila]|uniref:hypothetical protein n=2 Tax=Neptunomonas phycophila TaxID=1572645 RepID=UPI0035159507
MRFIFTTLMFLTLSSQLFASTTLLFGGFYSLTIPEDLINEAKMISLPNSGLALRTSEDSKISAYVISPETENLSKNFLMTSYPEFMLGLKNDSSLSENDKEIIKAMRESYTYNYDLSSVEVFKGDTHTAFLLVNDQSSTFFITQKSADQLLILNFENFELNKAIEMIKGEYHVK